MSMTSAHNLANLLNFYLMSLFPMPFNGLSQAIFIAVAGLYNVVVLVIFMCVNGNGNGMWGV